jgi:uncharacterized protein (DUF885 family)
MKKILLILCCFSVMISCQKKASEPNQKLATLLEKYWDEQAKLSPLSATSQGDYRYNSQLVNDISSTYLSEKENFNKKYLAEIEKFNPEDLNPEDLISYDIFRRDLSLELAEKEFETELIPIHQFWGTHQTFAQFGSGESDHPFKTVKDYDDFLSRIKDFQVWADTAISNMQEGMGKGIVLPKSLVLKVIPQMTALVTNDAQSNLFYGPIKNLPKTFSVTEKTRLTKSYEQAIMTQVVPTFKKLGDFFQKEYLPKARKTSGIGDTPNGKKYYDHLVRYWTTTDLRPEEIHELGLREVARIRAEMEKIKSETGYKGDLKSFFEYVKSNEKFRIYKNPKEVLDGYWKIYHTMEPQLKKAFNQVPKSKFEIRQTEAFRAASASAEYLQGTPDGSRPGIFYVPILDAKKFTYPGMESLFLHEAIPGHHYQSSLQMENEALPKFRRFYWSGAYGEGWALYCESMGKEMGLYTNPYQYFGALGEEMHRAIRLVVDTGIHNKGWSREESIKYSLDNEPISLEEATAEIERYMAIPGQALSYKVGSLKIRELRTKYEKSLGAKFNLAAFHHEVLKDGCLPIDILEKKMAVWAEGVK